MDIRAPHPGRTALLKDLLEARGLDGLASYLGPEEALLPDQEIDETARLVSALQGRELTLFGRPLPFCGRREALESVYNAVRDAVAERRLHIVEVVGAVGLGKTRVLAEALSIIDPEARGIDVLPVAVREGDGPQSLLARLVRRRFGILLDDGDKVAYEKILEALEPLVDERLLVGHARLLGHLAGLRAMGPGADALSGDLEAFRRQAQKALISLFRADLAKHPRILVLQRASRLHETAVEVLSGLIRELHNEPLVLAVLGDDLPPDFLLDVEEIQRTRVLAEPLAERDLERLIGGLFADPQDAAIRGLVEAARGNPRLLLEATRLLVQTGRLTLTDAGLVQVSSAPLRYPLDLEDASRLRVEALSGPARTLLQVAAVIGPSFDAQALTAIASAMAPDLPRALGAGEILPGGPAADEALQGSVEAALADLQRSGLVRFVSGKSWSFYHASDRARLLDELSEDQRVALHALAGQWLDAAREASDRPLWVASERRVAFHWHAARRTEETARALLRAAELARAGLAMGDARALYRQALHALGLAGPTRGLDRAALLVEALLASGELAHRLGDLQDARRFAAAALEATRALTPYPLDAPAARAYLLLGKAMRALGNYGTAQAAIELSSELFRLDPPARARKACAATYARGSADALVELARLHWVQGGDGGYARARELLEEALVLRRALEEPRPIAETLGLIANIHLQRGDFDSARGPLEEALSLSRAAFDMAGQARALMTLGAIAFFRGSREDAVEIWKEGLHAAEMAGERELIGAMLDNIGEARLELGDLEHAASALLEAREITRDTGDLRTLSDVLKNLALLDLRRGELLRAQAFADEAVALGTMMQAGPTLAPALRARGLVRSERAQRESSAELATKALADLTEARDIFTRLGDHTELKRTEAALAEHLQRHPPI